MMGPVLLDTGPLVAYLLGRERHHRWAREQFRRIRAPQLTCEAVLTEALFLLRKVKGGSQAVMKLLTRGVIEVPFHLEEEIQPITELLARYADVPMSLADACLVRMAELYPQGIVFTLDKDFRIYRKHGRQVIPTIMPDEV